MCTSLTPAAYRDPATYEAQEQGSARQKAY
ncbi:MAG: hypothetical protein JWQ56_3833, partial [Pseudarthrobacter sp.]|nr:hypothetical protein [Pseudarthrobacter sp.]